MCRPPKNEKNVKFSDKNDKLIYFKNNDLIKLVCGKKKKIKKFIKFLWYKLKNTFWYVCVDLENLKKLRIFEEKMINLKFLKNKN